MVNIDKIKTLAKEKGKSLAFLCKKMGVARVYFNDIEKHGREISLDKLEIIARELDTTVEYLRDETDDPEIKKPSMVSWKGVEMSEDRARLMNLIASLSDEDALKIEKILEAILKAGK